MPSAPPKPTLLLAAIAAGMALLVGLVGSSHRAASPAPALGPLTPWPVVEHRATRLAPPRALTAEEASAETPTAAPRTVEPADPAGDAPRTHLGGLVVRPDGQPADGARVKLGQRLARCTADGRFQLRLDAGLEAEDLIAHLPGFEPAVLARFGASASPTYDVRITLGPETRTLVGTLVDASGHALPGWTVELDGPDVLRDHGLREPVLTDQEGRFSLPDVPAYPQVVRAWREHRERAAFSLPTEPGDPGLTIVAGE
ncbi:MAG TPA: carboxypeptidase-like regulatory domain-containing protein [Planctomycetota bacterium]